MDDLAVLRARDHKTHQEVMRFILGDLRMSADTLGKPLRGRWEGCRVVHTYNDKWRVVWEPVPEFGAAVVLMVGERFADDGSPLYDRPRPSSGL